MCTLVYPDTTAVDLQLYRVDLERPSRALQLHVTIFCTSVPYMQTLYAACMVSAALITISLVQTGHRVPGTLRRSVRWKLSACKQIECSEGARNIKFLCEATCTDY